MLVTDIARVKAQIKFLPVYTCKCGHKAVGDTRRVELDTDDASELSQVFARLRHTANHMPVGWASFYSRTGDDFRCAECH